jgi:hypothetical protein
MAPMIRRVLYDLAAMMLIVTPAMGVYAVSVINANQQKVFIHYPPEWGAPTHTARYDKVGMTCAYWSREHANRKLCISNANAKISAIKNLM